MTPQEEEELEELLEQLLWIEEEIKNIVNQDYLDEFSIAYLKNLIKYWERDNKRIRELIQQL